MRIPIWFHDLHFISRLLSQFPPFCLSKFHCHRLGRTRAWRLSRNFSSNPAAGFSFAVIQALLPRLSGACTFPFQTLKAKTLDKDPAAYNPLSIQPALSLPPLRRRLTLRRHLRRPQHRQRAQPLPIEPPQPRSLDIRVLLPLPPLAPAAAPNDFPIPNVPVDDHPGADLGVRADDDAGQHFGVRLYDRVRADRRAVVDRGRGVEVHVCA